MNPHQSMMFCVKELGAEWPHDRSFAEIVHVNPAEGDLVDVYGHVTEVTLLYVYDEHGNTIGFEDLVELIWYGNGRGHALGCYSMAVFMDETWRYRW